MLRRRNFYEEGQATPYGQPVRHAERIDRAWQQVLDSSDFESRRAEIAHANAQNPHSKRGLAITPVKFGISFNFTSFNQAGALVHVYKDGSVLINHGGTEMGQGLHTKMLQVAATAFGLPIDRIRLAPTRTDKVPNTSATAASSGADLNGAAVKDACDQILARLEPVRAILDPTATWDDVVRTAYFDRVQLWAAGFYKTEGLHWNPAEVKGEPFKYFAYGVAAAEVTVDGFTGAYQVDRVDIVHDVGDSLSPLVDIGQIEGGFVQGVGWLTLEDLRWDVSDGPHRGRLSTQAASTYKLPSLSEMPADLRVTLLDRATEDGAIYGSKAVGEPPLMLAFSVREALRDAVAAFGSPGVPVELPSPATPEAVYWAVERARGGAEMDWLQALQECRERRTPCVLVTVTDVSGHAPREAGAKLVVTDDRTWGSVGGGNLEEAAVRRARGLLRGLALTGAAAPVTERHSLSDKVPVEHGVQCCGGEVTLLLEPMAVRPAFAVFGMGHVGYEIALLLSRHPVEVHLVDSRADQLARTGSRRSSTARPTCACTRSRCCRSSWSPSCRSAPTCSCSPTTMPRTSHPRRPAPLRVPGTIGLIGSSAKWTRFRAKLADLGHAGEAMDRVRTPIGDPATSGLPSKEPGRDCGVRHTRAAEDGCRVRRQYARTVTTEPTATDAQPRSQSEFDRDIAVSPRGDEFEGTMPDGWRVGGGINGGFQLSLLGNAIRAALPEHPDPVAVSAYYISPAVAGPVVAAVRPHRVGGRTATVAAELRQGDDVRLSVLATYGDLAAFPTDDVRTTAEPIALPPRDQCVPNTMAPDEVSRWRRSRSGSRCSSTRTRSAGRSVSRPGTGRSVRGSGWPTTASRTRSRC